MTTLVLPIAGKSSRFDGIPKWTLRDPKNRMLMVASSIEKIWDMFDRCVVIALQEHTMLYPDQLDELEYWLRGYGYKPEIVTIPDSISQPMTVHLGIEQLEKRGTPIDDAFMVKDCDNQYSIDFGSGMPGNFVAYGNVEDYPNMVVSNKSYITFDSLGMISNIVEKRVISSHFCVGGYGFKSTFEYVKAYLQMSTINDKTELHLSHLIYAGMMHLSQMYAAVHCTDFIDWGTQEDWEKYKEMK